MVFSLSASIPGLDGSVFLETWFGCAWSLLFYLRFFLQRNLEL